VEPVRRELQDEALGVEAVVSRCAASDCLASCKWWLASCGWLGVLSGVSKRGSVREVEDILLSGWKGRGNGRAVYAKRSDREKGREMVYKKVQVLTKILRN